ncbi:MAG TPA: hypothetical protein VG737_13655 [Cyclobacteriaceae bacterium]|nr:hypothetical protein [Cyclobacteriaceae bacterium]
MRYFVFVMVALLLSCQKDASLENVCADPIGSEDIVMKNNTQICFKEKFNACFRMHLTDTANYILAVNYNSIYPGTMIGMMTDGGSVRCLGDVDTKPTSQYYLGYYIELNRGYVVKLPDDTYGRIYIDSWIKNSAGRVTEVHVTWQYSY